MVTMARASMAEYQKLVADRPRKFSVEEADFKLQSPDGLRCSGCWHWAQIPNQHRSTCEIVAPDGDERMVPPEATCKFQTADGSTFPRLEAKKKPEKKEAKSLRSFG